MHDRAIMAAGRIFFAIGAIGLGLLHLIYQQFVTGRAPPWPEGVTGGSVWASLTGAVMVGSGIAILSGKWARPAAVLAAALVFVWALLRHIPVILESEILSVAWTHTVKALCFVGGFLAVAATFPKIEDGRAKPLVAFMNREGEFILAGKICLAVFMVNNGIQHFIFTDFVASLIPSWFPGDSVFWTYFASVALFAGALGMFYARTARLAALLIGIMVFSWVWIVHVPRVFLTTSDNISVFEALAVSGIAFILARTAPRASH